MHPETVNLALCAKPVSGCSRLWLRPLLITAIRIIIEIPLSPPLKKGEAEVCALFCRTGFLQASPKHLLNHRTESDGMDAGEVSPKPGADMLRFLVRIETEISYRFSDN